MAAGNGDDTRTNEADSLQQNGSNATEERVVAEEQQRQRDVTDAATDASVSDAALSQAEARDALVAKGHASYFRKEDQEGYMGRLKGKIAAATTAPQRKRLEAEMGRARTTASVIEVMRDTSRGSLEARQTRAKEIVAADAPMTEFFSGVSSKSIAAESKRKYTEARKKEKREAAEEAKHWKGKKLPPGLIDIGGAERGESGILYTPPEKWEKPTKSLAYQTAVKKEAREKGAEFVNELQSKEIEGLLGIKTTASEYTLKKHRSEKFDATPQTSQSELDAIVSAGAASYFHPREREGYKSRIEEKRKDIDVKLDTIRRKLRSHRVPPEEKRDLENEEKILVSQRKQVTRASAATTLESEMTTEAYAIIGAPGTRTKPLTAKKEATLSALVEKTYRAPVLSELRAGVPTFAKKRGEEMFPVEDLAAAIPTEIPGARPGGVSKYKPTEELHGQVAGPGGKSAKKLKEKYPSLQPGFAQAAAFSVSPEIAESERQQRASAAAAELYRIAQSGTASKREYEEAVNEYREARSKVEDKTFRESLPVTPKLTVMARKKKTEAEIVAESEERGRRLALRKASEKSGRIEEEIKLGTRIRLPTGKTVTTSEWVGELKREVASAKSAKAKEEKRVASEAYRQKVIGEKAPWMANLPLETKLKLEPEAFEVIKSGGTPVPVYEGGTTVFPYGEPIGVTTEYRKKQEMKRYSDIATSVKSGLESHAKEKERGIKAMAEARERSEFESERATEKRYASDVKAMGKYMETTYKQEQKLEAARKKYAQETPFGRLALEGILSKSPEGRRIKEKYLGGQTPWDKEKSTKEPPVKTIFEQAFDEIQLGRKHRAVTYLAPTGAPKYGPLYGGGLQPVYEGKEMAARFPKKAGVPRNLPNPVTKSELRFFGSPFGVSPALRARNRKAARKVLATRQKRTARRITSGRGSFSETLFW